jgi:hypothetical protein
VRSQLDPMVAAIIGHRGDGVDQMLLVKYKNRILQVSKGIPSQIANAAHRHASRVGP